MLFRHIARKFGKVPIYISGERNIRLSDVGQVYHGTIYALSGGEEVAMQDMQIEGLTEKEYGMVRLKNVGDVLFQALLLDNVRFEDDKICTEFCTCFWGLGKVRQIGI